MGEYVRVWVSGRVQGVSYRYATCQKAQQLGLSGWVRNLPDGRVEALVRGDTEQVRPLLDWMAQGPEYACVETVKTCSQTDGDITQLDLPARGAFEVRK